MTHKLESSKNYSLTTSEYSLSSNSYSSHIALKVFINERGLAKVEIAVAKGKKDFDKRESLKQSDASREMDRARKVNARY